MHARHIMGISKWVELYCVVQYCCHWCAICSAWLTIANDWELVRDLVALLRSLSEEEFLAIMYGEWFVVCIINICTMMTAKC